MTLRDGWLSDVRVGRTTCEVGISVQIPHTLGAKPYLLPRTSDKYLVS
jgi:hypothetical protein